MHLHHQKEAPNGQRTFSSLHLGDVAISTITQSELQYGVEKSGNPEKNRHALALFLLPLTILEYDQSASHEYGKIRAEQERKGLPIGPLDMLIAAHAKSLNVTLVTNNTKEFSRVPGQTVENWV